jgi:ribosome biogenesis GTPase
VTKASLLGRVTGAPDDNQESVEPSHELRWWTRPDSLGAGALPGIVTRAFGKFFNVQLRDEPRTLLSTVKGSVRRERRRTDLVAVGDRVWVTDVGEGEGQIEAVEPRRSVLARLARRTKDVEQVILANPDQALFLFAIRHPEPHLRMLDRFLVLAESRGLPAIIGVNKIDLDDGKPGEAESSARALFSDYERIYPVLYISVRNEVGLDKLRERLDGKVTVVAGPSGAGKSSLLNRLDPDRERTVGEISGATGKGRHTTTAAELYRISAGTYVADTPGIRALAMHGVALEELDRFYPEFRPYLGLCFYPDCTHIHEPGCAVKLAVESVELPIARYESYVSLRRGESAEE